MWLYKDTVMHPGSCSIAQKDVKYESKEALICLKILGGRILLKERNSVNGTEYGYGMELMQLAKETDFGTGRYAALISNSAHF